MKRADEGDKEAFKKPIKDWFDGRDAVVDVDGEKETIVVIDTFLERGRSNVMLVPNVHNVDCVGKRQRKLALED